MGENSDSFFDKILLKNIDVEIPIGVSLIDTSAKNSASTKNIQFQISCRRGNRYLSKKIPESSRLEFFERFSAICFVRCRRQHQ